MDGDDRIGVRQPSDRLAPRDCIRWIRLDEAAMERLEQAIRTVCGRLSWVKAVYLFGSAARTGAAGRDVDIGLVADPAPDSWRSLAQAADDIALLAGLDADDIDLRVVNGADPVFLKELLAHGRLVYEADVVARVEFEVRAMSVWLDFKPVWERMRAEMLERWGNG